MRTARKAFQEDACRWQARFEELKAFQKLHGHCNVPALYAENTQLGHWIKNQKTIYKEGRMRPERAALLNEIGFIWSPKDHAWTLMFEKLKLFMRTHGHCHIPRDSAVDPELAEWVFNQRVYYQKQNLCFQNIKRLEGIGFKWYANDAIWQEMYVALKAYRTEHGHCNVPGRYKADPSLGRWVIKQRYLKSLGDLTAGQISLLDAVGFIWNVRPTNSQSQTIRITPPVRFNPWRSLGQGQYFRQVA